MTSVQGYFLGQCSHLLLRALHVLDEALAVKNQDSRDAVVFIEAAGVSSDIRDTTRSSITGNFTVV